VHLHGDRLELPRGLQLDLGATAKARSADLTARRAAETIGVGVLVELGGDIATAGPGPEGGWQILVADSADDPACRITLHPGWALATSSTVRRAWRRGGVRLHHIVDPRTAAPAAPVWRSASVAAPTCVEANTASTAAVVLGHEATRWLGERGFTARMIDQRHRVCRVGDWPQEVAA
jgi:FAD:protein FMN transferase